MIQFDGLNLSICLLNAHKTKIDENADDRTGFGA